MWGWGRPKRDIPQVNYAESSEEEENFEDGLTFNSPLISPQRPLPTREGSPVELAHPTLNDNVDETLEEVTYHLHDINQVKEDIDELADLLEDTDTKVGGDIVKVEEVLEFNFNVAADCNEVAANNMPPAVVSFENENGEDKDNALFEACRNLSNYKWNPEDLLFYFGQIEIKMAASGVKKQFTKFQILSQIIPSEVIEEVKPLLRKTETEFTQNDAYKQLKSEILRIFGSRPEASIERALGRVMTGKPSTLARQLRNDICKQDFNCPCCPATVTALWKRHLGGQINAGIAKYKLDKDSFNEVTELADSIWQSNAAAASVSAIKIGPGSMAPPNNLDETLPAIPYPVPEVNAVRSGRGGGNRGRGRGRGGRNRGGQSSQSHQSGGAAATANPRHKGAKHPDLPAGEWSGCSMHYKHGKGAFFCSEPATCPWKNIFASRPAK